MSNIFNQPIGITWRKALLSAPRLVPDAVLKYTSPEGPHPVIINVPSRGSHQIPLYVFIPTEPPTIGSPSYLPVLLDFHGGGFIFGSCQEQAPWCAYATRELQCITISVDYRLGPAATFPAATEDAEDIVAAILTPSSPAYDSLRQQINAHLKTNNKPNITLDTKRLAVSGFSSGGNLALGLGLSIPQNTQSKPPVSEALPCPFPKDYPAQIPLLLFYPSLDARQLPSERTRPPAMGEAKPGFFASSRIESELMPTYLPRHLAAHPRASPGLVDLSNLHDNAKIWLCLPELDTLAEQSGIWVEKVKNEGRGDDLIVRHVEGVMHGWTQFPDGWSGVDAKRKKWEVFEEAKDLVKRAWSGEGWVAE